MIVALYVEHLEELGISRKVSRSYELVNLCVAGIVCLGGIIDPTYKAYVICVYCQYARALKKDALLNQTGEITEFDAMILTAIVNLW